MAQELPPGFTLDPPNQQTPQLPQGFTVDQPQGPQAFSPSPQFPDADRQNVDAWKAFIDRQNRIQSPENVQRPDYPQMLENIAQLRAQSGEAPPQEAGQVEAFARGVGDTFSFGAADEAAGAIAGLGTRAANLFRPEAERQDPAEQAGIVRERARAQQEQARTDRPISTLAGNITGGVSALAGGGAALTARAPQFAAKLATQAAARPIAAGTLLGTAEGAVQGLGSAEGSLQERAPEAGLGALAGGAFGAVVPGGIQTARGIGGLIGEGVDAVRNRGVPIPELEDLRQVVTQAYQAVDAIGATYTPRTIARLGADIRERASAANINPRTTPKAAAVVDEISSLSRQPMTLTQLDQLRQSVGRDLAGSLERGEQFFGKMIIDQIDNLIENATPRVRQGGQPGQARALIRDARQASRTHRAAEVLNEALDQATLRAQSTGTGGNVENAIRQNLRRLISNKKTRNLFNEEQTALIRRAIVGDDLQNALRLIGTLSPDKGFLPLVTSLGAASVNPLGLAVPVIGFGARRLGEARQAGAIESVTRAVRGPN